MLTVLLLVIAVLVICLVEVLIENHRLAKDGMSLLKENLRLKSVLPPPERNGFHDHRSKSRGFGIGSPSSAEC